MNLLSERLAAAMAREQEHRNGKRVTKAELARVAGVSDTAVGNWLKGDHGMDAANARSIGGYLGVNALWLETGEGEMLPYAEHIRPSGEGGDDGRPGNAIALSAADHQRLGDKRHAERLQPTVHSLVKAFDPEDGVPDDMVLVPESRIEFSAGDGTIYYELVEDAEPATYRRSWFQKHGINPDRARRFRVTGDSMEPLLYARDTILVNQDETQVVDGRVYALRYRDQLRVKYLSKRIDDTLVLRSANPAYKDEEVPAELANEHITVIGRVRDKSGPGGL